MCPSIPVQCLVVLGSSASRFSFCRHWVSGLSFSPLSSPHFLSRASDLEWAVSGFRLITGFPALLVRRRESRCLSLGSVVMNK